jgi:aryl-alcohol dehydrogenase-like predicted oxidoreductase
MEAVLVIVAVKFLSPAAIGGIVYQLTEDHSLMNELIRQGKILYWGVSEWPSNELVDVVELCRSHGWAVPVCNQPQYSLLWRSPRRPCCPRVND